VAAEIGRTKPDHVRFIDHVAARLFWDVFQIEEERLKDRKRAQAALERAEKEKETILDTLVEHVIHDDRDMKILWANRAACASAKLARKELIGRHCYEVWPKRSTVCPDCAVVEAMKTGLPQEVQQTTPDGKIWRIRGYPERDENGHIVGGIEVTLDITDRKRTEKALQQSEQMLQLVMDNIPQFIFWKDINCVYLGCNQNFARVAGLGNPEDIVGKTDFDLPWRGEEAELFRKCDRQVMDTNTPEFHIIESQLQADGKQAWVDTNKIPLRDAEGNVVGILGAYEDITDRKQAEEALRESEDKYRGLFNNAQVGLFRTRINDGKILECNERLAKMFGYESREACLADFVASGHYLDPGTRERMLAEIRAKGEINNFEARLSRRDGSVIWVRYSSRIYPKKGCIEGVATDITEEKHIEAALLQAKEDWENTFDAITDMVMLLDNRHRIIRVNKAVAEALKVTKDSLVDKKCYEVFHRQSHPIRNCPLVETMKTLEPQTVEIADPDLGGTFICSTSPVLDREGKLTGYTHVLKDITESKRLEAQFQEAQRLEAVGTLAGGIAHDFNNLLMGIQGRASLMLMDIDSDHPHFAHVSGIEEAVKRGAHLTKQLLGFARGGKYEVRPTGLNELIEKSSEMLGRAKKEIKIHRKYQKDIWTVEIDRGQIEQVLVNLYVNAWQAMPEGGDLYLETKNVRLDENNTRAFDLKPGHYVKISMTDTGVGMDEGTRQRVFEPFFTTKELGVGTGLGLASAYGIIKNHGGMIEVHSRLGRGATFNIYLPASEKEITQDKECLEEMLKGTETVLLVDDEDMIIEVGKEMLTALGYTVVEAENGKQAIALYREKKDKIDMVVLDLIMPDMGGGEVYDRLKEMNPKIRVLLSSGYSMDDRAKEIIERGCDGFIQKPFSVKELSGKLREILEKK